MGSIQVPTGTRATLVTRAGANQLVAGRLYYLTDDQSFVMATGTNTWTEFEQATQFLTANVTARPGQRLYFNTAAAARICTLPTAVAGAPIVIGRIGANTVTVARNGNQIAGLSEDLVLDADLQEATLIPVGTGWRVTARKIA